MDHRDSDRHGPAANIDYKAAASGIFLVAVVFGLLVDAATRIMLKLPELLSLRMFYFIVGFIGIVFGASLFIKCKMPITPFGLFVRDLSNYSGKNVRYRRKKQTLLLTSRIAKIHRQQKRRTLNCA